MKVRGSVLQETALLRCSAVPALGVVLDPERARITLTGVHLRAPRQSPVHSTAVYVLAAVASVLAYRNVAELVIARYSGCDPPMSRARGFWLAAETCIAVAAAVTAIVTL